MFRFYPEWKDMKTRSLRSLGGIIFLLGVSLGLALALAAIWSDFEGFSYFNTGAGYQLFNGLVCPILMTRSEKSVVTADFENPSSQEFKPFYEVAISRPGSLRKLEGQLSVPAHTTKSIQWTVDANDIDLGFFIFVDVQVLPMAEYSTHEGTCGIMVLDLTGITGSHIFAGTLAASLIGLVLGLGLWENDAGLNIDRYTNRHRLFQALGIMVLLALLASIIGLWAAGLVFCILAVLLLVISLRQSMET
jgi:hypothetical protein